MKARNNRRFVKFILHITGLLFCIAPPITCTLSYFPLWKEAGAEKLITGGTALLIIVALIPFYKQARRLLESSASYVMWLIIFLFCFLMSRVIDEITVISFAGLIGNLIGAALMKIGESVKE